MVKRFHYFLMLCLYPLSVAWAQQQHRLTGQVIDENGDPLEGVTIITRGANALQSVSGSDGGVQLNVRSGDVVVFNMLGYVSQEIAWEGQTQLTVTLVTDHTDLEEVVVVGYGTQKKVNLTGSVSTIGGEELERRPIVSTSTALQGLAPGVTDTSQSGAPGGDGGQIRVRGVSSFGGSDSSPLILIDGVAGSIDMVDANLIESISVLKDAASAAIYG